MSKSLRAESTRPDGGGSYLVEVHVHALQLEVRRAIVAMSRVDVSFPDGARRGVVDTARGAGAAEGFCTYTPLLSRPCSLEMFCLGRIVSTSFPQS